MRIGHPGATVLSAIVLILCGKSLFAQGSLNNIQVSLGDNKAGEEVIYTFTFETSSTGNGYVIGIPNDGKIQFTFSSGFDVSTVNIAQSKSSKMTGGFSNININNQSVILTRDGTGNNVSGLTVVSIAIGLVRNSTLTGSFNVQIIVMENSNTYIDTGTTPNFTIIAGLLHHFQVITSGNATAGANFPVTMMAQDAYNNTVTSFASQATLNDKTGTMNPKVTSPFSNGVRNEYVIFTKSYSYNQITVTYDNKSGMSALFNVLPAALDHFTFDTISSPKTAGTPFNIKIIAQDQYGDTVTSFTNNINLTDKTGTLTPSSSGNFSSGSKTVVVTITTKANDDQITATDPATGKKGQSNSFNINAAAIHDLIVRNNPGGLGNQVGDLTLNLNNQLTLYAAGYDQWGNYVRDVKADWGRTGTLDMPFPLNGTSTTIIPTTPQTSGQIYADSSGIRDYTGTISVGSIHHVLIRDAANGGGNIVQDRTITADDTLKLYAAAYDAGNNYLGPAIVNWFNIGNLQPAILYSNMNMIAFAPTTAPTAGRIVTDHNTALDDTTGIITVNPGAPVGQIVLHPNPTVIPAHPDSFSIFNSNVIRDSDGNLIATGELFTISTSAGKITSPVDQAPAIAGHQVKSNWSSQISFIINADSIGGTAYIHVNSVGKGSAAGDTTLVISGLQIVSINTDHKEVSRGQQKVTVRMTVKNQGIETAKISQAGAGLKFCDSFRLNRSGDYMVTRTDTFTIIPGMSGQKVLSFAVNVAATATTDSITIDGYVSGWVKGKMVSDSSASQVAHWLVQTPPSLRIERILAADDTVAQGKTTSVSMIIRNNGDASVVVDHDSLIFWAAKQGKYVTHEYEQVSSPSNPDTIRGHSSSTYSFSVRVGATATLDTIIIDGRVTGHDVNTNLMYSDFAADFLDGWRVKEASDVTVSKFSPNQITVTSGQDHDWYLKMVIKNRGDANLRLDSLKIKLTIGAFDISNQYQILKPDTFLVSGNDTLRAGAGDTLKITIDKTGTTLGTITIEGMAYLNDMISGQIVTNAFTGIIVQSPASLSIDYVRTSQPEVTVAQAYPWKTIVAMTNSGGSDIAIDSTQLGNFINVEGDTNFVIRPPVGFQQNGSFMLRSGETDSLFFTVDTTGNVPGNHKLNVMLIAREINSQRTLSKTSTTTIKVEQPANIRIAATKNLAPNAPYVDIKQIFPIGVIVENLGQDGAKNITVSLSNDSASTVMNPISTLSFIPGGKSDTLQFSVQAYSNWIISEVFKAKIDTAIAENTPEPDKIFIGVAIDSVDTTIVQRPAKMKIVSVTSSKDTVRALSRDEWQIVVAAQDSGAGFIQLAQPTASDIAILIESDLQEDYTIVAPASFKNSHSLTLSWWAKDTLIYRVTSTGIRGGLAKIKVNLSGKYLNQNTSFQGIGSTRIFIRPAADVYIDMTEPLCPNINQYGIGQVNKGQNFTVRAKIRNAGGERVDNVVVSLTAPGYSIKPDTIAYIPQSEIAWINFNVTAKPKATDRVSFVAKITAATSHESGLPASIGAASDSVAAVRIHEPALLKLSINKADSIFTVGKSRLLRASVQNLGTAEVDSSGEIYIKMPADYQVMIDNQPKSSDTTGFKVSTPISWQVQPPQYSSTNDTVIVAISKPPLDLNTNRLASIDDPFDTLIVKTIRSMLSINSFKITSPKGATDDTLSTLQDFWIQVDVTASEDINNRRAELSLPEGYSFGIGIDKIKDVVSNKASWKLKAAENEHINPAWIKVTITGTTENEPLLAVDSLGVVTQKRALLAIEKIEIASQNAADSTLSMGQEFDLSATVHNYGQAQVIGFGLLKIQFGATGITATRQDTIKPFVPDTPVIWRLKAPDTIKVRASITVSLDSIPLDENTNLAAQPQISSKSFRIETQPSGTAWLDSLWISSPSGALDRELSTYQAFIIEADVRWHQCRNTPSITLHLSGGFTTEAYSKFPSGTEQQGRVSWNINAPEDPIQHQPIWLSLSAQDKNSGREFTVTSDSLFVKTINRATIQLNAKIVSPKSATDNIVSIGQKFVIGAFLSNSGEAKLSGNYTTTLNLPEGQGYTLLNYPTQTAVNTDTLFWMIEAPLYSREAKNIEVDLVSAPEDENTSIEIVKEAITVGSASFPIQTEEKTVMISVFQSRNKKYTITRGDSAVAMLGLEFICSGNANSNNVLLSGVKIKLKDRSGNLIDNPESVISRVAVVKYRDRDFMYGQVTNVPSSNPIEILFSQIDTLEPEISNKIEFLVDINANPALSDFRVAIDSTDALYLVDEGSGHIPKLKNVNGQTMNRLDFQSESSVIIEDDFYKAFGNYPNPFGNPTRLNTHFIYNLAEDTEVKIQIYTLIGELVWSRSYTASEPQGKKGSHEADIVWDGRNGQGHCVLNGVYIASISTGYGKSAFTKIVVIK